MASPLDPSTPTNLSSPGLGDDEFRAIKQWLVDVLGVPVSPTAVAAAGMLFSSAGLTKLILQNLGSDTAAIGEIGRNGNVLEFYDTVVRKILHNGHRQLKFKTANEGYAVQNIGHFDSELFLVLEANSRYAFELFVNYAPQVSAQGLNLSMVGGAGVSVNWAAHGGQLAFTTTKASGNTVTTSSTTGSNTVMIIGHAFTVGSANLHFNWSGTSGQSMNVYEGSWIKAEKLP